MSRCVAPTRLGQVDLFYQSTGVDLRKTVIGSFESRRRVKRDTWVRIMEPDILTQVLGRVALDGLAQISTYYGQVRPVDK